MTRSYDSLNRLGGTVAAFTRVRAITPLALLCALSSGAVLAQPTPRPAPQPSAAASAAASAASAGVAQKKPAKPGSQSGPTPGTAASMPSMPASGSPPADKTPAKRGAQSGPAASTPR